MGSDGDATADLGADPGDRPARPRLSIVPPPSAPAAPDYAGLLQRIAAGDRAAEAELMQVLSAPLGVVLRNRARGVESVDDLRQEALLVVLQATRAGRIDEPRALVEYALETARRLALNAERKKARHCTDTDSDAIATLADGRPDLVDVLAGEQLRDSVGAVLAAMPNPRDRQLLLGYYLEELPSSTLQARYAMDSGQLGRVLHRARQRFAALWHSLGIAPPDPRAETPR